MTAEANEFLKRWCERRVRAIDYSLQRCLAKRLTTLCIGEAARDGITRQEVTEAAGGDLRRFIAKQMEKAQDTVVKAKRDAL